MLIALAVVVTSACSTGGISLGAGPLGEGREDADGWLICVPASTDGQYAFGTEVLRNPGHQDAVLSRIELVHPVNLTLNEAVVVDIDHMGIGVQDSWPPSRVDQARWQAAVPLDGAVIPAGSKQTKDVVLHLSTRSQQPASLEAFVIHYKVGGAPYAVKNAAALKVGGECGES